MPKRVPEEFREFVAGEVATLRRGYLVPFEEMRTNEGPGQSRVIMPVVVEP